MLAVIISISVKSFLSTGFSFFLIDVFLYWVLTSRGNAQLLKEHMALSLAKQQLHQRTYQAVGRAKACKEKLCAISEGLGRLSLSSKV